ncbi:RNA polymerase sigma factor [Sediminibacillus massiliensis]|uniref:RNA polymerase sigma factor n=1 Tax=Sediminibacillus massiliensis TaxID=1926277 RepID=UPI00098842CF|nr:sigma-70 family RNA polymerase sigma factor [Sediminibacillus massiliensis]
MNDPEQLEQLNKEMNVVYRYLRKMAIPHEDAQDIVQEAAYKFLLYYDSIKTPKIRSWLIRVVLNFHHDQYRKNRRVELGLQEEQVRSFSDALPEDIILSNETLLDIENILNKLKPKYRELIQLKYIWSLKYEDISQLLDMNIGTVKTSLFRARKQFVKLYRRLHNE